MVDSEHQPLLSASSDEEAEVSSQPPPPSGLQVLEAHQIFEPLLASAGEQLLCWFGMSARKSFTV